LTFIFSGSAAGQEAGENSAPDPLQLAAEHMELCEARLADDLQQVVPRCEKPLLTFGDPARQNRNGTLWTFGEGRPAAFLELYQGTEPQAPWVHAITLTGTEGVILKTPSSSFWRPDSRQIEPAPVPDAPAHAGREPLRLRQMKQIARRFTAHEFWDPDNSRFELRLLVQPVLRYRDESAGVIDGAAFVLAHGTNPEVILLIEAHGDSVQQAQWRYSLARMGSAEFHVELDGAEVWSRPRTLGVVGSPTDRGGAARRRRPNVAVRRRPHLDRRAGAAA
jgi:hypothetical protein